MVEHDSTAVGEERRPAYASWGQRAGAFGLDILVGYMAPGLVVGLALALAFGYDDNPQTDDAAGYGLAAGLLVMPLFPLYLWLSHWLWHGRSVGKRVNGLVVVREDGSPLSGRRALVRTVAIVATWFMSPLWIVDLLWPLWDARRQALHDKVVKTVVVRVLDT